MAFGNNCHHIKLLLLNFIPSRHTPKKNEILLSHKQTNKKRQKKAAITRMIPCSLQE